MKVVYTETALKDLEAIADWLMMHYPAVAPAVERRIRTLIGHILRAGLKAPAGLQSATAETYRSVMAGLVPAIHVFLYRDAAKARRGCPA